MDAEQLLVHPERILQQLPGCVFWKDCHSVFLGCNQNFADIAGISSPKQIIGKSDVAVNYSMANDFKMVIADDQKVMQTGEALLNIQEEQMHRDNKILKIITSKYPLPNQHGEIVGIFGIYLPQNLSHVGSAALAQINQFVHETSLRNAVRKKIMIEGPFGKISLSQREAECIREILFGKTIKEIAKSLQISPRTVEEHMNHIKRKTGCCTRSQLTQAILASNFLDVFT